jgi:diketogulonate reductase-like aldo/keto reductase
MLSAFAALLASALFACAAANQGMPGFPLHNAAVPGLVYPAVGLGTGGYGLDAKRVYPECWVEAVPGCAAHSTNATATWLKLGGRRIDSANSYANQAAVRAGIQASGVPRSEIFITSKVGPSLTLGPHTHTLSLSVCSQAINL